MGGITDIKKAESHLRLCKRLKKQRDFMPPLEISAQYVNEYCQDGCIDCVKRIQETFILTGRVPQIVDTSEFYNSF